MSEDRLTIGRDPSCSIVVDDKYVSLVHASVTRRADGSLWIADEGSINGTWVNGARVRLPTPVRHGDRIKVGRTEVTVP